MRVCEAALLKNLAKSCTVCLSFSPFDLPTAVVPQLSADRLVRIGRNSSSGALMKITAGQAIRRSFAFRSAALGSSKSAI